jgi:hypothetical protein
MSQRNTIGLLDTFDPSRVYAGWGEGYLIEKPSRSLKSKLVMALGRKN